MDLAIITGYSAIFNLLMLSVFFSFQTYYKKIAFFVCYNMISLATTIFCNLLIYEQNAALLKILFPVIFLMIYGCPPHFYFIINRLIDDGYKSNIKNAVHYLPVIISISVISWLYFQSPQFQTAFFSKVIEDDNPLQINILNSVFIIQSLIYTGISYRKIYRVRKYSAKNPNVGWLWRFINFIIIASVVLFSIAILYPSAYNILIISSIVSLIYYFALIFDLLKFKNDERAKIFKKLNLNHGNSVIFNENDTTIRIANKIDVAIHKDKIYKDKFLTVTEFAIHCNLPQYLISQFLKKYYSKTFNEFINDFRVEEVIRLLNGNEKKVYSIEMIGQFCGFNSKSAFYNAFKKYTGITPKQYMINRKQGAGTPLTKNNVI